MGAPDTTSGAVLIIDDFEYVPLGDNPLNQSWSVAAGSGTVASVYQSAYTRYAMQTATTSGIGFKVVYPSSGSWLDSKKSLLSLQIRNDSGYAVDVLTRVKVSGALDTLTLRLVPDSGASFRVGDTIVSYLGPAVRDLSGWGWVTRSVTSALCDFDTTLHFWRLDQITVRGNASVLSVIAVAPRNSDVEGYASSTSVAQGGSISFYVSKAPNFAYPKFKLEVFRAIDLRAGSSPTALYSTGNLNLLNQPVPVINPWLNANWSVSHTVSIPTNWKSGVYVARLTPKTDSPPEPPASDFGDAAGQTGYIAFIVREDQPGSTSKILAKCPTNTWQAYNPWGGGSFYNLDGALRKNSIGYNRPMWNRTLDSAGTGQYYRFDFWFDLWCDSLGLTAEYCTDEDLHELAYNDFLSKYKVFVSLGHDEYWSSAMRNKVEDQFRDSPTAANRLLFLSSNTCYWRTGMSTGRLLHVYKQSNGTPPNTCYLYPPTNNDSLWNVVEPEGRMMGVQLDGSYGFNAAYTYVKAPNHWIFRGIPVWMDRKIAFSINDPAGVLGGVGYEVDYLGPDSTHWPSGLSAADIPLIAQQKTPNGGFLSIQCHHPLTYSGFQEAPRPDSSRCDTRYFQKGSAKVFATGTMNWVYSLVFDTAGGWGVQNNITSRMTRNIITHFASDKIGPITANQTWSDTVRLFGDVVIDSGVTVTVQPGSRILCYKSWDHEHAGLDSNRVEINVKGKLVARGTVAAPIYFESPTGDSCDWYGIVTSGSGTIDLKHAIVRNACTGNNVTTKSGTWTVDRDYRVSQNAILNLLPGTTVKFASSDAQNVGIDASKIELIVEGTLISSGIPSSPVKLEATTPGTGQWYGLRVTNSGMAALGTAFRVSHAITGVTIDSTASPGEIRGAYVDSPDIAGFWCESDSVRIVQDTVANVTSGYGIMLWQQDPRIDSVVIQGCEYGIYAFLTSSRVRRAQIQGSGSYGVLVLQTDGELIFGVDTLALVDCDVSGYFSGAHYAAGSYGHSRIDSCEFVTDTTSAIQSSIGVTASPTAWVKMRRSLIRDYGSVGYYSNKSTTNLGKTKHNNGGVEDPGNNSIYSADTGGCIIIDEDYYCIPHPKCVSHLGNMSTDTLRAENNWWDSVPPPSSWFTNLVDRNPYLSSPPAGKISPYIEEEQAAVPQGPSLEQNYPNPFNPSTSIRFTLPAAQSITLDVFNVLGQRVRRIAQRDFPEGNHELIWDGKDSSGRPASSGVYFYRLITDSGAFTRKMVIVR